jgi:phosphoglycolate phosphatase-like HAD superfamily hydrolase
MTQFLLIFDLDGTLIDTVPDLANALNEALREHGYAPFPPREVQAMVGDGLPTLLARGFAARGADSEPPLSGGDGNAGRIAPTRLPHRGMQQ